jgi:4-hydroxybenzoate polyprenyltransferase
LSAVDAAGALLNSVERRRFRFQSRSRTLEHTATGPTFDIQRVIRYRNTFLPRIRGRIQAGASGSSISVTMSLPLAVQIFALAWLTVSAAMVAMVLVSIIYHPRLAHAAFMLFIVLMLRAGWRMIVGGFSTEAAEAERLLLKMFKVSR